MGDNMFRLKDRKGAELCLGMTHEEIMTSIARNELRSYKQLPQIWYQIQTKFRDEPRPKSGLLRVRQFLMKDAYSFDIDEAGLDDQLQQARRGLPRASSPAAASVRRRRGRLRRHGRLRLAGVHGLHRRRRRPDRQLRLAATPPTSKRPPRSFAPVEDLAPTGDGTPELVHTPAQRAIDDIGAFLNMLPRHRSRRMAYMARSANGPRANSASSRPVVVFLRGDHSVNETKLLRHRRHARTAPHGARRDRRPTFKGPAGYLGPIGLEAAPHPKQTLGDGLPSSSIWPSKAAPTWSPEPTRRSTTSATSPPAATSPRPSSPTSATSTKAKLDPIGGAAAEDRQSGRDRPHLQARLQVHRIAWALASSTAKAKKSRRSWAATASASSASSPRPSSSSACRRQRAALSYALTLHRSLPGRRHRHQRRAKPPCSPPASRSPPTSKPPASTSSSTTATSAPASNSRTPNYRHPLSESMSARSRRGQGRARRPPPNRHRQDVALDAGRRPRYPPR